VTAVTVTALLLVLGVATPAAAETIREMQWFLAAVHATQAHDISRGNGVVVAVIDSGVDAGHPDLAGAVLPGRSFGGNPSRDGQTDDEGHGTAMAALIAARGGGPNNALGIAPRARILPVAVPTEVSGPALADAIRWAVDQGAKVINMSLSRPGGQRLPQAEVDAIAYAQAEDVVFVTASGNADQSPTGNEFGRVPGVISVAGLSRSGRAWSGSVGAESVALAAPAEEIVTAGARQLHDSGYRSASGTSDSAAIVSGVAALVRSRFPDLDAANVVNRLVRTAEDEGPAGRDPTYGFGAVDARRALSASVPATDANPLGALPAGQPGGPGSPDAEPPPPAGAAPEADDPSAGGVGPLLVVLAVVALVVLGGLALVIWLVVRASRRRRPGPPGPPGAAPPYGPPPYGPPPGAPAYGQQPGGAAYGQQPGGVPYGQRSDGTAYGQQPGGVPYGQRPDGTPYGRQPGPPDDQQPGTPLFGRPPPPGP
jgi:type VII secretion-associated serine protease mycosin